MPSGAAPLYEEARSKLKICLAGQGAVGKTSLIRRFVHDEFDDRYIATLGTKVTRKDLRMKVKGSSEEELVVLLLWDIMGNKGVRDLLQEAYFSRAQGVLMVCDVTRPETLRDLESWKTSIEEVTGPVPAVVLANKVDLEEEARVKAGDVKRHCKEWDVPFFLTSAKTGKHVEEAFLEIAHRILESG